MEKVESLLNDAVSDGVAPALQAAVFASGRVFSIFAGKAGDDPVTSATLFDLASITKVMATTSSIGLLMQKGKIGLDDRLSDWLVEAKGTPFGDCTVEQLLSHRAGFAAHRRFYEAMPREKLGTTAALDEMVRAVLGTEPEAKPGQAEIYSDLDFILLGAIVKRSSGMPLDKFFASKIARPLGLDATCFLPAINAPEAIIAPTGYCDFRKRELRGEVNDTNTWAVGGVSGQAGLFGTASDCIAFATEIIDGFSGEGMLFDEDLLEVFGTRPDLDLLGCFALGWDTVSKQGTLTGKYFGKKTIGHHGFTGTSLWVDPEAETAMALLTNRIHNPGDKSKINTLRRAFFDTAWEEINSI